MNTDLRFDGIELWQLAGWTMLHFLWLGTLVGLGAGACRVLLRQASPNARYVTAVITLVVLASLPLSIAAWLVTTYPTDFLTDDAPAAVGFAAGPTATPTQISPPIDQTSGEIIELSGRNEMTPSNKVPTAPGFAGGLPANGDFTSDQPAVPAAASTTPRQSPRLSDGARAETSPQPALVESLQSFALYLPWIWLVGTPIMSVLLATGLVGTRRLRLASRPIHDGQIPELLAQLKTSLCVGKRVGLAVCDRIATPVLVGILRPMILLPPAALTGWSPDEIEMVLLHELAHVRRWDNLVNLAQRIIESLLFFHPVVWLVSNWIRREREACCDAIVVSRTKRPHAYAELLVALAAELPRSVLVQPAASSAMAAGPLRARIRRILQLEDDPMLVSGKSFGLVLGSLLLTATLGLLYLPSIGQAEESTKEIRESFAQEANVTKTKGDKVRANDATEELTIDTLQIITPSGQAEIEADNEPGRIRVRSTDATASGTPPDTGTQPAPSSPLDDNRLAPPGMTFPWEQETPGKPTDDDREEDSFEAYNVSRDLIRPLENWTKFMKVKGYNDKPDRFIMQAPQRVQEQLQALLDATKRWQSPSAILERGPNSFVKFEKEGQPRLNWRTMGLTLGPAREIDQPSKRPPRVIGPEVIAVEPGSPAAWLAIEPGDTLTHVSNFEIRGLMSLESLIKTMLDASTRVRHTITFVKSDGTRLAAYLPPLDTDRAKTSLDDRYTEVKSADGPNSANVASQSSKFPSLEDQKLADLAYKRLGLELEPIDADDLRRVKSLGYDGGVKVSSGTAGIQGHFAMIEAGDILVGLHVWPTTTMKQVAEVLSRDDLAELNPLKFYVVRRNQSEQPSGVSQTPGTVAIEPSRSGRNDIVVTGRVTVNLIGRASSSRSTSSFAPRSRTTVVANDARSTSITDESVKAAVEILAEAGVDPTAGPVQVEMVPHNGASTFVVRGPAAADPDVPAYMLPSAAEEDEHPKWPQTTIPGVMPRTEPIKPAQSAAAPAPRSASAEKPLQSGTSRTNLRYEGKTFEEWRDASRIELSTERQTAAVQALAAFGAHGYAREATEAILDVAARQDFNTRASRQSPETTLRSALTSSFTSRRSIDKSIAFPIIIARFERDPEIWRGLLVRVLSGSSDLPSSVVALVHPILEVEQPDLRAAAVEAIYNSNPPGSGELLASALRDRDPQVVTKGLQLVGLNEMRSQRDPSSGKAEFPIEPFLELLFRPDSDRRDPVRELARDMLRASRGDGLSDESIGQVLARLTEVLTDHSRKDEHLLVLRAIRAMGLGYGRRSNERDTILDSHKSALERIFRESKDVQLRIAAAFALQNIDGSVNRANQLIQEANDLPKDAREQMRQLIEAEEDANW